MLARNLPTLQHLYLQLGLICSRMFDNIKPGNVLSSLRVAIIIVGLDYAPDRVIDLDSGKGCDRDAETVARGKCTYFGSFYDGGFVRSEAAKLHQTPSIKIVKMFGCSSLHDSGLCTTGLPLEICGKPILRGTIPQMVT